MGRWPTDYHARAQSEQRLAVCNSVAHTDVYVHAGMRRKRPPANVPSGPSRRKLEIDGELRPSAQPREIFGEPISREAEGAEADMVKRARHRDVCAMHALMAIDRAPGRSKAGLPQTSPSK